MSDVGHRFGAVAEADLGETGRRPRHGVIGPYALHGDEIVQCAGTFVLRHAVAAAEHAELWVVRFGRDCIFEQLPAPIEVTGSLISNGAADGEAGRLGMSVCNRSNE